MNALDLFLFPLLPVVGTKSGALAPPAQLPVSDFMSGAIDSGNRVFCKRE